jgi:hypothetical protein
MTTDILQAFRAAVDASATTDRVTFARHARNGAASAIVAAAVGADAPPVEREPPAGDLRALVGPELADQLLAVYAGDAGWASRAIDVLEPLHALARRP